MRVRVPTAEAASVAVMTTVLRLLSSATGALKVEFANVTATGAPLSVTDTPLTARLPDTVPSTVTLREPVMTWWEVCEVTVTLGAWVSRGLPGPQLKHREAARERT